MPPPPARPDVGSVVRSVTRSVSTWKRRRPRLGPGPVVPDPMSDAAQSDADRLVALMYDELRTLARAHLRRERVGHTLSTTALVNEAYLRLAGQGGVDGADRRRFFAVASATMRRLLIDHARRRRRLKRGGGLVDAPLEAAAALLSESEADELLALDDALERLAAVDPRGSAVVQHRFFGGLTLEETAEVLGVSTKTVQRDWLVARAWLRKEVARDLEPFGLLA
jgi:RNA polymerase sigma-70 factor, ECF subfamily